MMDAVTERVVEELMNQAAGENDSAWALGYILDGVDQDWTWEFIQTKLAQWDDVSYPVVLLFGLIHDQHQAIDHLMAMFNEYKKEAGVDD